MINIKNKKFEKVNKSIKKEKQKLALRLLSAGLISSLVFIVLIFRLSYLQFVKGKEYSQMAYNQQMKNKIISPKRGTIYDCNGDVLALSVAVDTVSINPSKVCNKNNKQVDNKIVAEGLSKIFSLDYDETLKKVESKKNVVIIARKVPTEKISELQTWMQEVGITTGINIDEDSKRYYPNNEVASNLIGFCSTDNVGLWGLEERWNDALTGTSGKIVTAKNVKGEAISDENEQYVEVENGKNIYLTIDTKIQRIAEKYLKQAVIENKCKSGGNVIIMKPQTGDILAMATYPDYNLNEPFSITPTGITEEEWQTLPQEEQSAKLLNVWKNRAVSELYEPGSTFKLITSAIALEENIVTTDNEGDFFCTGSYHVGDKDISCWKEDGSHGVQSLRKALQNSCNPAFMQLGQKIGHRLLYKYYEAFGLFSPVGDDIAKAYKGNFFDEDKIVPVELATMVFGQRITITPLQLISAVSTIANDGIYVKPRIVSKIENIDEKSIENVEVEEIRQVISLETSQKMKNMMQSVVTNGTGRYAKVEGYSVGGKSGTSEPTEDKLDKGYVASFIAISPIENTQVVVLVILYHPTSELGYQGGQTAGPVASQILSEVLPCLGVPADTAQGANDEDNLSIVPNVVDKTVAEAKKILISAGFNVQINISGDENTTLVSDQTPKSGIKLETGSTIYLYTVENEVKVSTTVPNVKGMSIEEARNTLKSSKLNVTFEGKNGIVVSQDPSYETEQEVGTIVHIVVKEKLKDGQ